MSNLTVWTRDPFADFDSLIRHAFGPVPTRNGLAFTPAADITRDGKDAVVRVELPGVDVEKDVSVEIDRGRLVIRGERHDEHAEERNGRTLREVRYGSFRRSFGLPKHVSAEQLTASYDAGVLTVRVTGVYAGSAPTRIPVTGAAPAAIEQTETPES